MVKKDCQALFGGDNEAVGACITIMIDKIDEYYEKVSALNKSEGLQQKIAVEHVYCAKKTGNCSGWTNDWHEDSVCQDWNVRSERRSHISRFYFCFWIFD